MKIYRCVVLDSSYKKCVGMIEAEDEQDVKAKIISQGYSVLSVKEVSSEVKMTTHGFEPLDEATSKQASVIEIKPPEVLESSSSHFFNKYHLMVLFCLVVLLIGGYFYFILLPKINQKNPDQVLARYMELGYEKKWGEQFDLLDQSLQNTVTSLEQYGQSMEEVWREYPREYTPEDDDGRMILRNERYQISSVFIEDSQAQYKIFLNYPKETKELIAALNRYKYQWKIRYLRDMTKISNYIERLAEGVRPEIEEKMLLELKLFDGFKENEIHEMVTKAKIDRLKKMRQDEIDRRERIKKIRMEREEKDADITNSSQTNESELKEPDLVQEKLEETIKMVEELGI